MGLSSFPSASEGVLHVLVMNTVLSISLVKGMVRSILQIMGHQHQPNHPLDIEVDPTEASSGSNDIKESVSITLFKYVNDDGYIGSESSMECSVCLYRFEDGEEIGELSCKHCFHKGCLETWFDHSHTTCPLCRSSLIHGGDIKSDTWDQ